MTEHELRFRCSGAVETSGDDATVMLLVRGAWPKRGEHKRLGGRAGGPLGRCVSDGARPGMVLCAFRAREVLAWLDAARGARGE